MCGYSFSYSPFVVTLKLSTLYLLGMSLTLSLPESNHESAVNVVVAFWMNPYCVTIQMAAIEQYFHMVLFVFDNFAKINLFFPQF